MRITNPIRASLLAIGTTVMLAAMGCMYEPTDGDRVYTGVPTRFQGFAGDPNETVHIETYSCTGLWKEIAKATSSPTPWTLDDRLYFWETTVDVADALGELGCGLANGAILSVRAIVNGGILTSFDQDGQLCINQKMDQGYDIVEAGWLCRISKEPVLGHPGGINLEYIEIPQPEPWAR